MKYFFVITLILQFSLNGFSFEHFAKHPNGLLTPHYGVLKESDLKYFYDKVICHDKLNPRCPYTQWQCAKNLTFKLVSLGGDIPSKPNFESKIKIVNTLGVHTFSQRRGIHFERGKIYEQRFKEITKKETHACVAGFLVSIDKKTSPHTYHWIWETIKTKKGYLDFLGWNGEYK